MIVEGLVGALVLGGVALLARRTRKARATPPAAAGPRPAPEEEELGLGDVLLHEGDELWLAGAVEIADADLELRLFRVPESATGTWAATTNLWPDEVALLADCAAIPGGEVPLSLPIDGLEHRMLRRGRAIAEARGEELPPDARGEVAYALLEGPAGRAGLVLDFAGGPRLTLHGQRLSRRRLMRLPGRR